jgi:hypothetical protein
MQFKIFKDVLELKESKTASFLIQTKNVDQSDRATSQPTVGASMSAREGGIDCALINTS